MQFVVFPSLLHGQVIIPGSKSHTIRALVCALLSDGSCTIQMPLDSRDTRSCLKMIKQFGASVEEREHEWEVIGCGMPKIPDDVIDVGNSGTSLYFGIGLAALINGMTVFTGDHQIRNRPADDLLSAITELGGYAVSTRANGKPPIVVQGPIIGGQVQIKAITSQYLSSLLVATPKAKNNTIIDVPLLNEAPYVGMTLWWLNELGIEYHHTGYRQFIVKGNQRYKPFTKYIPADFSSATFFMVAAAVTQSTVVLKGLDFNDTQGDKEVVNILKIMGAEVDVLPDAIAITGKPLKGGVFDLNAMPDALPALSVCACFADGETRLVNVPQARVKETDRIAVMCGELKKMGANIEELPDGLVIHKSALKGAHVNGHHDHRIVMSLAVAGLAAEGSTTIDAAESVSVTFPNFVELMQALGANIRKEE